MTSWHLTQAQAVSCLKCDQSRAAQRHGQGENQRLAFSFRHCHIPASLLFIIHCLDGYGRCMDGTAPTSIEPTQYTTHTYQATILDIQQRQTECNHADALFFCFPFSYFTQLPRRRLISFLFSFHFDFSPIHGDHQPNQPVHTNPPTYLQQTLQQLKRSRHNRLADTENLRWPTKDRPTSSRERSICPVPPHLRGDWREKHSKQHDTATDTTMATRTVLLPRGSTINPNPPPPLLQSSTTQLRPILCGSFSKTGSYPRQPATIPPTACQR